MNTRYYIFSFTLLLLFVCLGSLNVLYANGITFEMLQDDRSKLPEGPSPSNDATYNSTTAQTFTFTLTGIEDNEYYDISVALSRSNFKGYAANFPKDGGGTYKDLEFLQSDYVQTANGKKQWTWNSDTSLSFSIDTENNAKPGNIVVRCHDWGANGSVSVTIEKRGEAAYILTKTVPYDEANKNGIADTWETVAALKVLLDNNLLGYDPTADAEVAPDATNPNNGDGWTNYDEYRGIFTEQADASVTRLDPTEKDIIYTLHTSLQAYGLGQLRDINKHRFRYVDSSFVKTRFTEVYEYAADGEASQKSDIDDLTGRINYNSNPGGSWTPVPNAKDVWAIRIKDDDEEGTNDKKYRYGHATNGSPSKYSLIKIFTTNIRNYVVRRWDDIDWVNEPETVNNADAHKTSAIKKMTSLVIAHEVVHSINVNHHCEHLNCLMRAKTIMKFYSGGVFYIVKYMKNPEPEPDNFAEGLNWKQFVEDKSEVLLMTDLNDAHLKKLAVTGHPSTGISECSCVEINSGIKTLPESPVIGSVTLSGDTSVLVSWGVPASDGGSVITDYEYRYRVSGSTDEGVWTSAGVDLSETVSGLIPGLSYLVEVRSKNSVGYSVASAAFSFTMPPITPGFSPAPGSSYTAVAGETHTSEVRSDSIYGAWLFVNNDWLEWVWGSPTATSLLFSYTFPSDASGSSTIKAHVYPWQGDTYGDYTVYSYTVEVGALPPVPVALSAVGGSGSVTLTWQMTARDVNYPITHYEYRYGIGTSVTEDNYTPWTSTGSTAPSYTVSSLTNNMFHIFEVRAVNTNGNSDPSVAASATPRVPTIPGQPTGLTSTSANGTVTLSWNASETGGSADTYMYRIDPNNDGSWNDWEELNSSNTSATLNLQNGRSYGIQVLAKNSIGSSAQSLKTIAMPVDPSVSVPSAPRNLRATGENGQVRLSWNAPSRGTPVIDYEYKFDTNDDGSWRRWKVSDSTSTSYTVTPLTNGTLYAFKVRARNTGGAGTESGKVTATPINITVPSAPRYLTAQMTPTGRVLLNWHAPLDTGGSLITDYEYIIDTNNNGTWGSWGTTGDRGTDEYFGGFTQGVTYAFKIRAVNSVGAGGASNKATITIPVILPPTSPLDFLAVPGNGSVDLSWSSSRRDGGGTITYQFRYQSSGGSYSVWSPEQSSTNASITGLTNGTHYDFQLRAKNSGGTSGSVIASATPTDYLVPGVPQYLTASSRNGAVDLWWDAPAYDGGSVITDYEYRYRERGGSWYLWSSAGNATVEYPEYTVTGLTNGTSYDFEVRAINAIGAGPSTGISGKTPNAEEPDTPTGLSASAGSTSGSIDLSWSAPEDGGSTITGYQVKFCKYNNGWRNWTDWSSTGSTSTSYTVSGLDSGGFYRFRVAAVNNVGSSRQSKAAQANAP